MLARPFTGSVIDDMLRAPDVEWDTYHWTAVRACFATLAEEGSRKDEVAKEKASTPFRKGRFTFASLVWKIGGAEQDNRRQEEARKRARGSAGETLGDELRALGEGLRRALAGAQGGEHANERGGKFVRTSGGPASAP